MTKRHFEKEKLTKESGRINKTEGVSKTKKRELFDIFNTEAKKNVDKVTKKNNQKKEIKIKDLVDKLNEWGDAQNKPQKLEDMLPFLKSSKEEIEYAKKFKETVDSFTKLMESGKVDEAIKVSQSLKWKEPQKKNFTEQEWKDFVNARAKIAKLLGFQVVGNKEKFFVLEKEGYLIQMKHFMHASGSGYNNGRINEIELSKGKINALRSNGWYNKPKDEGMKKILDEIVAYLN